MQPTGDDSSVQAAVGTNESLVEVDALHESSTHVSGVGWRLLSPGGRSVVQSETRRRERTLVTAELYGARRGLEQAAETGTDRILLRLSDPNAVELLRGERPARLRRAGVVADSLASLLARFRSVRIEVGASSDPALARAVGDALDAGLHAVAERERYRAVAVERIAGRARSVQLQKTDSGWVANGRYHVQLDPMSCECPAWSARWARAPIAGRRASRLPCKHLVALAARTGTAVPSELAQRARRAPG